MTLDMFKYTTLSSGEHIVIALLGIAEYKKLRKH